MRSRRKEKARRTRETERQRDVVDSGAGVTMCPLWFGADAPV